MHDKQLTTIYVVRHGESIGNYFAQHKPDEKYEPFGELGSPLTEKGGEQAKGVARKLKNIPVTAVFSSDLTRAKETAEIIAQQHNLHVVTNDTIRERDLGKPITKEERKELEKSLRELNEEEKLEYKYVKNGESGLDAVKRFKAFLDEIIPLYPGKTILVVNHGNVMRSFLISTGFAKYDELPSGSLENTGYFVLETDGQNFTIKESFGINKIILSKSEE